MSSLKSRMIIFMMRNRHLLKFHMKREAWDEHTSIPRFREECEQGAKKAGKLPPGIDVTPLSVAGMPAEWICPVNASKDAVIFYTHGGGYVTG
jgi:monoterpene epsilon-lactone hydrolase